MDAIENAFDSFLSAHSGIFSADTIANAKDLLNFCLINNLSPKDFGEGYWPTIRFFWENSEIEIFENRLEIYHFYDGATDIWYEDHTPGQKFSERFVKEISALPSQPGMPIRTRR